MLGHTKEELVRGVRHAKEMGFTAVGHLTPFLDEPQDVPFFKTHANKMRDAIDTVRACREAVGDDVDLCIEIHRRLTPAEAITLAHGIEEFHPFFYEDPIWPENFDAMALVAQHIAIPIATGERLHDIHEFEMLLARNAVQYVRPDVCHAGGLTHCKKIAALAEARYVGVVPHNPLSPVSTAACLQLARLHPQFRPPGIPPRRAGAAQERHREDFSARGERLSSDPRYPRYRHRAGRGRSEEVPARAQGGADPPPRRRLSGRPVTPRCPHVSLPPCGERQDEEPATFRTVLEQRTATNLRPR